MAYSKVRIKRTDRRRTDRQRTDSANLLGIRAPVCNRTSACDHLLSDVYSDWPTMSHIVANRTTAVENSRHNKSPFLTLPFEFGSVAGFSFLVAIASCLMHCMATSAHPGCWPIMSR